MSSDEPTATDHVHALADTGAISTAIADRLDDNGFETIADLLIADQEDLEDVPYVGAQRAAEILAAVDTVTSAPEPRDIDLEATESVVSEAALPLSVRRGEKALVAHKGGTDRAYHTRACATVENKTANLAPRDWAYVDDHDLDECARCEDASVEGEYAEQSGEECETDFDPLVDSREVILEATLGEKLQVTLAERDAWAKPWTVIEAPESTEWESAIGGGWQTRRLRLSESASGEESARECDLVLAGDEMRIEDPPVKHVSHQPDAPGWGVEIVGAVGRVSTTSLIQLQTDEEAPDTMPEGDDTWRKYQRGETA